MLVNAGAGRSASDPLALVARQRVVHAQHILQNRLKCLAEPASFKAWAARSDDDSDMSSALQLSVGSRFSTRPRSGGRWIDHWLETRPATSTSLRAAHPMMDAVIEEVDGRMIRVGEQWLADFASCNYLGFDLDREIIAAIPAYLEAWGTHPSWSRLLGSPVLYEQIETRLTELLGCEDSLVLPTITHIHASVIPVLAASGTIFLDARAHKTIYDGCQVARARGAAVRRFRFEDPGHLDELLSGRARPRAAGLHGRRQQHDRATRPTCGRSPRSRAGTARCCTSTTPTASG